MEQVFKEANIVSHMAGIVPVAGRPLGFKMPWHDCMMPVANDFLAVERAVWECVLARCNTIWIVCHASMQPLLRKRIGDFVYHPKNILYVKETEITTRSNIFYVSINPIDRDKRDTLGWSVLHGANTAYRVCKFISKWVVPEKFYCAFPYGVTCDEAIIGKPHIIKKWGRTTLFSHNGKTVQDNEYCSFTFDANSYKKCRNFVKGYALSQWDGTTSYARQTMSLDLTLGQIFKNLDTTAVDVIEYPWFYSIDTWENYCKFLGSGHILEKNKKGFSKVKTREKIHDGVYGGGDIIPENQVDETGK